MLLAAKFVFELAAFATLAWAGAQARPTWLAVVLAIALPAAAILA